MKEIEVFPGQLVNVAFGNALHELSINKEPVTFVHNDRRVIVSQESIPCIYCQDKDTRIKELKKEIIKLRNAINAAKYELEAIK